MLQRLDLSDPQIREVQASGCCRLVGDDLGHRPMVAEYPGLAGSYVSGGSGLLDLLPGAMSGEADHGIPNAGAGSTGLAGGVRVGGWADRDPSSGWCVSRQ